MRFTFKPMAAGHAHEIAGWRYQDQYSFYDMRQDPDDLREFLDPGNWPETYFVAVDEGDKLLGFFSFHSEDGIVTIGLGLRPDLTGRGMGLDFVVAGLQFARQRFSPHSFRLSVALFNERAIRVYERAGFRPTRTFMQETNGGQYEFLEMTREARPEGLERQWPCV